MLRTKLSRSDQKWVLKHSIQFILENPLYIAVLLSFLIFNDLVIKQIGAHMIFGITGYYLLFIGGLCIHQGLGIKEFKEIVKSNSPILKIFLRNIIILAIAASVTIIGLEYFFSNPNPVQNTSNSEDTNEYMLYAMLGYMLLTSWAVGSIMFTAIHVVLFLILIANIINMDSIRFTGSVIWENKLILLTIGIPFQAADFFLLDFFGSHQLTKGVIFIYSLFIMFKISDLEKKKKEKKTKQKQLDLAGQQ